MEEGFQQGIGFPVGRVLLVQGEVVIIHAEGVKAYKAKKNLPLYKGDIIITKSEGRIRLTLKDESILTLAPNTRLELNESVYDAKKKSRFSFLKMVMGKTRFVVKKTINFKRSEYKIKTPTAVVGVRGSDFIIVARSDRTEVTAFEDTVLEVVSLAYPGAAPIILKAYQKTMVEEGKLPTPPEDVSLEEAEQMKQDFIFSSEEMVSAIGVQPVVKPADKKAVPEPTVVSPKDADETKPKVTADTEGKRTLMRVTEATGEVVPERGVLVSKDDLVDPGFISAKDMEELLVGIVDGIRRPSVLRGEPDQIDLIDMIAMIEEIEQIEEIENFERIEDRVDTEVLEIVAEGAVEELPGFPGTP
jgi:hypothetical protein